MNMGREDIQVCKSHALTTMNFQVWDRHVWHIHLDKTCNKRNKPTITQSDAESIIKVFHIMAAFRAVHDKMDAALRTARCTASTRESDATAAAFFAWATSSSSFKMAVCSSLIFWVIYIYMYSLNVGNPMTWIIPEYGFMILGIPRFNWYDVSIYNPFRVGYWEGSLRLFTWPIYSCGKLSQHRLEMAIKRKVLTCFDQHVQYR